jgi:hypothetical protein
MRDEFSNLEVGRKAIYLSKKERRQKRDFDQPSGLSDMSPVASGHSVLPAMNMSGVIIALVLAPSSTIQDSECRVSQNFEPYLLIHDGLGEQTI